MTSADYRRTKRACYFSYFSMTSVFCLPPLLFATFRESYGISFTLLGTLVLVNFLTQLGIDLVFTFFHKHFNLKIVVRVMPLLTSVGLFIYALIPMFLPQYAYVGLLFGTVVFSVSAGLSEVLLSPIIAAIPSKNPERSDNFLGSAADRVLCPVCSFAHAADTDLARKGVFRTGKTPSFRACTVPGLHFFGQCHRKFHDELDLRLHGKCARHPQGMGRCFGDGRLCGLARPGQNAVRKVREKYFSDHAFGNDRGNGMLCRCGNFPQFCRRDDSLCAYRTLHVHALAGNAHLDGRKDAAPRRGRVRDDGGGRRFRRSSRAAACGGRRGFGIGKRLGGRIGAGAVSHIRTDRHESGDAHRSDFSVLGSICAFGDAKVLSKERCGTKSLRAFKRRRKFIRMKTARR